MHRLYVEECRSDHVPPVSYRSYKFTFFRIILIWGSALLGVIHAPNVINYSLRVTNSICTKKKLTLYTGNREMTVSYVTFDMKKNTFTKVVYGLRVLAA